MKKTYSLLTTSLLLLGSKAFAQGVKYDSIQMGAGYANQIYYDISLGQQGSAAVGNWDIAHTTAVMDNCIRANHMTGLQVMHYTKNTTWAAFDTSGWATWGKDWNDVHVHEKGAFNLFQDLANWKFGWGTYNTSSHEVTGDSMYLLAWFNGATYTKFLKFMPIVQNTSSDLIFKYADVDGSNEVTDTLYQSQSNQQNYKFYAFSGKSKPVREPANSAWDISFTRYYEPTYDPGSGKYIPYPVMGVETNRNATKIAKIIGPTWSAVETDTPNLVKKYWSTASNDLTAIGSNWKYFDNTQFKYFLKDTQSYVIRRTRSSDTSYWLIHFTGFGGSANGKVIFAKTKLQNTAAVKHPVLGNVNIFPNPVKGGSIYISLEGSKIHSATIMLSDITGKMVRNMNVTNISDFEAVSMPVSGLNAGIYMLSIQSGKNTVSQKIVIE